MRERVMIRRSVLAALLGAGLTSTVYGQEFPAPDQTGTADRTSLWRHIGSPADLGDIRGGTVT